jgi:two-component system cell cycle sensor histidine kinase PleC
MSATVIHRAKRRTPSLLADYSETLGFMRFRRYAELALKVGKMEAELANRSKSEFLANMSHELRTPLNAIIGFSELIQHFGAGNPGKSAGYAENISQAGHHLLHIISDILDISKIESGTSAPEFAPCDVGELIAGSVLLLRERIDSKKQKLQVQIAADLPLLQVDARRIRQILINLLTNAHKFTPDMGRITITAKRTADGGITIAVADTGPGMSVEELEIALKPFGQVRSGHMQSHGGVGLGLPIAIALARKHGGDLGFESAPGEGTTITLYLPASVPDAGREIRLPGSLMADGPASASLVRM